MTLAPYFCRRKIACRPNRPIKLRGSGPIRLGLNLASMDNGAFVIADFADAPSIVYLETALTGLVVERPEDVSAVTLRYETLKTEALPRAASLELLREVAKTWT